MLLGNYARKKSFIFPLTCVLSGKIENTEIASFRFKALCLLVCLFYLTHALNAMCRYYAVLSLRRHFRDDLPFAVP